MNKLIGSLALLVLTAATGYGGAPAPTLAIREAWGNVFGGQEAIFHIEIAAQTEFSGRMIWRLSAGDRTLWRNERSVRVEPGRTETVPINVRIPPVAPGVVYATRLTVEVARDGDRKALAEVQRTIHAFPEEIFHEQTRRLAALEIHLFDPVGTTADRLQAAGVELTRVHNLDALEVLDRGVIIIGEGLDLREYRALPEILLNRAAAGRTVLCLASVDGAITLAGANDAIQPERIVFRREKVIREWDKRLDADAWSPDGRMVASGVNLQSYRGRVVGAIEAAGWPWLEMRFEGGGRLIVCGFAIMEKWESGPTPRFLFARLLESFAQ